MTRTARQTTLQLTALRPRNPIAPAARARRAGRHAKAGGAMRLAAHRDLKRELDRMKPPHA